MYAITFDMRMADLRKHYPKPEPQAYEEIKRTLDAFGFTWLQGSVYVCENEDLANLTQAMIALKGLPWFPQSVRDIRAFRVEQWSDFTPFMKGN